ncbi:MAG: hypothetical protein ACSLFK_05655 [Gemmatimonadaceae bacterium]
MFIELIDLLRCPAEHEDSWLVAAFTKMEQRFVMEGQLGCPVCLATYLIRAGVAEFAGAPASSDEMQSAAGADEAMRVAAMLGLTRPGSVAALCGSSGATAPAIAELTGARIIVANPLGPGGESERVGIVTAGSRLPVAPGSLDGIVVESSSDQAIGEALRVLKPGGRIVAPAATLAAGRFVELARDDRNVVGETPSPLVALGRVPPR